MAISAKYIPKAFGPYNPSTGNRYRGINALALLGIDYTQSTLDDVQAGASPRVAGEGRGAIDPNTALDLGRRADANWTGWPTSSKTGFVSIVQKMITAAVFNAEQLEGIPALGREAARVLEELYLNLRFLHLNSWTDFRDKGYM